MLPVQEGAVVVSRTPLPSSRVRVPSSKSFTASGGRVNSRISWLTEIHLYSLIDTGIGRIFTEKADFCGSFLTMQSNGPTISHLLTPTIIADCHISGYRFVSHRGRPNLILSLLGDHSPFGLVHNIQSDMMFTSELKDSTGGGRSCSRGTCRGRRDSSSRSP